jgi:hypothetical protein
MVIGWTRRGRRGRARREEKHRSLAVVTRSRPAPPVDQRAHRAQRAYRKSEGIRMDRSARRHGAAALAAASSTRWAGPLRDGGLLTRKEDTPHRVRVQEARAPCGDCGHPAAASVAVAAPGHRANGIRAGLLRRGAGARRVARAGSAAPRGLAGDRGPDEPPISRSPAEPTIRPRKTRAMPPDAIGL